MNLVDISSRHGEDDQILSEETAVCLRQWLELAESGQIVSMAIVGEQVNGDMMTGHSAMACRYQVIGAMESLKRDLLNKAEGTT